LRSHSFLTVVLVVLAVLSLAIASVSMYRSNGQGINTQINDITQDASLDIANVASSTHQPITVYFFYSSSCPHCIATLPLIDDLTEKYPQVTFLKYQVGGNKNNWALYQEYNQKYHVSGQKVPSAFVGSTALVGEPAVKNNLESVIVSMLKVTTSTKTVPGAPTLLSAVVGDGQVNLSWNAPTNNGGATIDYFVIYQNAKDTYHIKGTATTVTGLANGVTYTFALAAHNSAGIGVTSNAVVITPTAPDVAPNQPSNLLAGPPTNLTAVASVDHMVLSWNAPENDGGATITNYILYWSSDPNGTFSLVTLNDTSYLHEGLDSDQTVYYQVAAINAYGEGERSAMISATTKNISSVPPAPTDLTVLVVDGAVSLTWTAASEYSSINGYNIYRGIEPLSMELLATASGTSFVDSNVTSGQTYYYEVSAINSATEGLHSTEVKAIVTESAMNDAISNDDLLTGLALVGLIGVGGVGLLFAIRRRKK
jgi:thiol-disulfide isomerase/thioredoxin